MLIKKSQVEVFNKPSTESDYFVWSELSSNSEASSSDEDAAVSIAIYSLQSISETPIKEK